MNERHNHFHHVRRKEQNVQASRLEMPIPPTYHTDSKDFDVHFFLKKTMSNFRPVNDINDEQTNTGMTVCKDWTPFLTRNSEESSIPISISDGSSGISAVSSNRPLCKICHLKTDSSANPLISPCRCSGTMRFVHTACLIRWLEISTNKIVPTPRCELCSYYYKAGHCFKTNRIHLPYLGSRDLVLHSVFLIVLMVMIGCTVLSIIYLHKDPHKTPRCTKNGTALHFRRLSQRIATSLADHEMLVVTCSLLFFCAFFIAVLTQYRAETSICRIFFRCWMTNRNWRIRNYNRRDDPEFSWTVTSVNMIVCPIERA